MEGDEIHEVNGKRVTGRPPDEVISILVSLAFCQVLNTFRAEDGCLLFVFLL